MIKLLAEKLFFKEIKIPRKERIEDSLQNL